MQRPGQVKDCACDLRRGRPPPSDPDACARRRSCRVTYPQALDPLSMSQAADVARTARASAVDQLLAVGKTTARSQQVRSKASLHAGTAVTCNAGLGGRTPGHAHVVAVADDTAQALYG